ncbi:DNA methylase N-4 [Pseudothermotoga hypogea DSM 11164 = NBRC 106472]|uniref:Methyltransferase n=1 Tax=Pseudothermotoga hypogea DSM 11164 = NBRC 106472 TaxID=1123384 RepID=A0A0X1KSS9_9THEM|nr:DNA methyltransferase [Pseudothermotoga hypogea]AJC74251.1 DNA methylase N-4 [Pseudothermotoga hypogea DSM 11164 = NBRC 106472]
MACWAKIIIADSRKMPEIADETIGLIVTSPPYWHLKDYGVEGQIGYGQSLHEYLKDLYRVWEESYRVLKPGRRLCVNIGDQFARSTVYGRYKIVPLHAEVISQCELIGFDYMGAIIWQKKTTMNTTGGATIMGSYPYPPNGMIEIDYEYILIFKKPGKEEKVPDEVKEMSKLSKEEWKEYFQGHWRFNGEKQVGHEAMFPEELPRRLIKMFSFVGDIVLDPFLGSGTTVKVALSLNRNVIGYEINKEFLNVMREKIGLENRLFTLGEVQILERKEKIKIDSAHEYEPTVKDASPRIDPKELSSGGENLHKVVEIVDEETMKLDNGLLVKFLGVKVIEKERTIEYLKRYLLKRNVFVEFDAPNSVYEKFVEAYVYTKNKIFVNTHLIKSGMALADRTKEHRFKRRFIEIEEEIESAKEKR